MNHSAYTKELIITGRSEYAILRISSKQNLRARKNLRSDIYVSKVLFTPERKLDNTSYVMPC